MRRLVAILLLCFFFSCGFIKAPQQQVATVDYPDSARALFLYTEGIKRSVIDGDTVQARRLFVKAIECDSAYAPAYYELANNMLGKSVDSAIRFARRATELDSTNRWYRQLLGQSLILGSRYAEAVPIFEQLVRTERNPDHYRLLAALYEQDRRPFSAIAILDSAERQFGINPYLGAMKRRLLLSTRQFNRALEETKKLAEAIPYEPDNHIFLGEIYAIMNQDSLAEMSFRRAIQLDSTNVFAWAALGEHYREQGNIREHLNTTYRIFTLDNLPAEEKCRLFRELTANRTFYRDNYPQIDILAITLHNLYPDNRQVLEIYADHLIRSGKIDDALMLYKQHTAKPDADRDLFTAVMEIESYLGHADSVTLYLNRALKKFPNDAELYIRRGHLHLVKRDFNRAIEGYREALKFADKDSLRSSIWGYIGDVYHQLAIKEDGIVTEGSFGTRSSDKNERKQMSRCYNCYDKALALHAENTGVLNNYAYFLSLEERNLDRALEMADKATALTENNPTYLDTRAWVLHKLGRNAEAKRVMRQAISLDRTNSADLQIHYGDILAALGEKFMAEVYWRKALANGYDKTMVEKRIERLKQQQ